MRIMQRLSIGRKLTTVFLLLLLLMAGTTAFSIHQLSKLNDQATLIAEVRLTGVRDALLMMNSSTAYRMYESQLVSETSSQGRVTAAKQMDAARGDFEKYREAYEGPIANEEERALYHTAMAAWREYLAVSDKVQAKIGEGELGAAQWAFAQEGAPLFAKAFEGIQTLSKYNDDNANADVRQSANLFSQSRTAVIGAMMVAVLCAAILGLILKRSIVRPLLHAVDLAESVARGDLTRIIEIDGSDELAQMSCALAEMSRKLRALISDVRSGIDAVNDTSLQIAHSNRDLAARSEKQASTLEETASTLEELTAAVRQNSENARQVNTLARSASDVAQTGSTIMSQAMDTMGTVEDSSKKIVSIIAVIDGIAFQTNILALNAAVEAARAGEHGRGFAVVAAEVRNLAQRCASAAKEISFLITESVQNVSAGTQLVSEASATMHEIATSVARVSAIMNEISAASDEQSSGIEQINQAVVQMERVTSQNATLVDQATESADALHNQAQRLAQTAAVFRLNHAIENKQGDFTLLPAVA